MGALDGEITGRQMADRAGSARARAQQDRESFRAAVLDADPRRVLRVVKMAYENLPHSTGGHAVPRDFTNTTPGVLARILHWVDGDRVIAMDVLAGDEVVATWRACDQDPALPA